MSQIRPDEVSSILKDQINGFNSAASLEEVGTVLQVGDGIARIYGLFGVQSGELVEFENGVRAVATLSYQMRRKYRLEYVRINPMADRS